MSEVPLYMTLHTSQVPTYVEDRGAWLRREGSTYVQRFRGGLVFEAHRLCVSLNSRLESNKEEEKGRR